MHALVAAVPLGLPGLDVLGQNAEGDRRPVAAPGVFLRSQSRKARTLPRTRPPMRFRTLLVSVALVALVVSALPARAATAAVQSPAVDSVVVSVPSTTLVMPDIPQAGAVVWPATESQSVTWESSDLNVAVVNPEGFIQPLRQGSVRITATSTADPTKSGAVTLTVVCPAPITVSRNVDGDTTWDNWVPDIDCYDYVVTTVVSMNDETLTIEPGTRVGFGDEEWLRVLGDEAALVAVGTADAPIVLTAFESTTPGHWQGIYFQNAMNPANRLDHVIVEYGGSDPIQRLPGANVEIRGESRVAIANSTLRHSPGFGLYAPSEAVLDDFRGNTLTANGSHPAYLGARLIGSILDGNDFTGNAVDEIQVETGTNDHLESDATWRDPGVPYFMEHRNGKQWSVVGVTLTLEPGVNLLFGDAVGMSIQHGGRLEAVGTAAAPIVLAAKNDLWMGLRFHDGFGALDQISILDGGRESFGANVRAAVTIVSPRGNEPPESRVEFGPAVTLAGTDYEIAFGGGDTYATGCVGRIFVQGGGARGDHCR